MTRYLIEPREWIFVKGYGFLFFAKNINKNLIWRYSKKYLVDARKSPTDPLKTTLLPRQVTNELRYTYMTIWLWDMHITITSLDNTPYQPSQFRTKNWTETNDDATGTCNINSQIKLKTLMLKSSLCGFSDGYILVKRAVIITVKGANDAEKWVIF